MDDINSIVSFKSGGEPSKAEPAAKAEPVVETPQEPKGEQAATPAAQERDEAGKFKAKEEVKADPKVETKVEPKEQKPVGQLAALMAERAKRQELERRLAALEKGQPQAEKPDIFTDPERAVAELVNQQTGPIRERFFKQSINTAAKSYEDFDAAAENFSAMMEANPSLIQQLRSEEDPGEFIYRVGSNTPEFREAQAAKTREQLSAKDTEIAALKAQIETLTKTSQAKNDVPESLNRQPSGAIPDRDSDTDIKNIVRFKSG